MSLATAFGAKLAENKDLLRTRTFEMGDHIFKVKVPLTAELEAMHKKVSDPEEKLVDKYYEQLTGGFKDQEASDDRVTILDNDILVEGRSLKEAAKNKAMTESRIVEMFKLLVPEETSFDMNTIDYPMIEELFPFSIQIEMMEKIAETISPDYTKHKKK